MRPRVRKAVPEDMNDVYLMGRDVWGKGETIPEYLASCRNSPKYREGEWFLLEDDEHGAVASLIVYRLTADSAGIGSIATAPDKRGNGFGAHLIRGVLEALDRRGTRAVFLFSDIAPRFYERFGFSALPPECQKHPGSACMIRARPMDAYLKSPDFRLPENPSRFS